MTVDEVEGAIDVVAGLAGRATGERHDYHEGAVVVMTDPEGHEFCLVQYYSEASALAAARLVVIPSTGGPCTTAALQVGLGRIAHQSVDPFARDCPRHR